MQRYSVHYTGRVQGVGFRATVRHLAAAFPVSGYVQNLPDGRVRLMAEGRTEDLDGLLDSIQHHMGRYIQKVTKDASEATGELGRPGVDPLTIRY